MFCRGFSTLRPSGRLRSPCHQREQFWERHPPPAPQGIPSMPQCAFVRWPPVPPGTGPQEPLPWPAATGFRPMATTVAPVDRILTPVLPAPPGSAEPSGRSASGGNSILRDLLRLRGRRGRRVPRWSAGMAGRVLFRRSCPPRSLTPTPAGRPFQAVVGTIR